MSGSGLQLEMTTRLGQDDVVLTFHAYSQLKTVPPLGGPVLPDVENEAGKHDSQPFDKHAEIEVRIRR